MAFAGEGPERSTELAAAVEACRAAIADYEAGLLSDEELRHGLFSAGLVHGDGVAWLLDLERGSWQRYDGVSLTEPMFQVRSAHVQKWRDSLDRLRDAGTGGMERGR